MAEKAPEAFRTISEASEDLDLPQHVLRFWETKFAAIKPLKRGGGRRYYRPEDINLLRGIRDLLYGRGYTIRGVQKILREQGVRHVAACGEGAGAPEPAAPVGGFGEDEAVPRPLGRAGGQGAGLGPAQTAQLKAALKELRAAQSMLNAVLRKT